MGTAEYEEVERPGKRAPRRLADSLLGRLRATASTGKALRLSFHQSSLGGAYRVLKQQGYALHSRMVDATTTIAWCERIATNGHEPTR